MTKENPPPGFQTSAGFTLLELLVVLAILALLSTVALPKLRLNEGARLRGASHALVVDLRLCRDEAIRSGKPSALVVEGNSYKLLPSGRTIVLPGGFEILSAPPSELLVPNLIGEIRFFPDGSSTGGGLLLRQGPAQAEILVRGLDGKAGLHG